MGSSAGGSDVVPTPAPDSAAGNYTGELSRSLSLRDNVFITLSAITPASSLFVIGPAVIGGVGGAAVMTYSIAALIGVTVALCYAELSSAFPITGGEYAFVARTMGKPNGFAVLVLTLVSGVFVVAVIASGVGTYLAVLWPNLDGTAVGVITILITTIVACFTIRLNARVTGFFLILEVAALVVLAVLGFSHITQPISTVWTATTAAPDGTLMAASAGVVVSYIAIALFSYNGYGGAIYYSEETRQAGRTIGRAILWSLLIGVLVQLIPLTAVVLGAVNLADLVNAQDPFSYFLQSRGGTAITAVVSIGIAIAIINAVLAITLQNARMLYSSARDRSWPDRINRPLARIHPGSKSPVAATVVVGIAAAALLAAAPFDALLIATGATVLFIYGFVGLSALFGRINGSTAGAPFTMPLWPAIPLVMLAATVLITYQNLLSDWVPVAVAALIGVMGLPYYYLFIRPRRGERWTLPGPADDSDYA